MPDIDSAAACPTGFQVINDGIICHHRRGATHTDRPGLVVQVRCPGRHGLPASATSPAVMGTLGAAESLTMACEVPRPPLTIVWTNRA